MPGNAAYLTVDNGGLISIVPSLCVGMQPVTLCVTIHWARVIGSSAFGAAACRLLLAEADSIADG